VAKQKRKQQKQEKSLAVRVPSGQHQSMRRFGDAFGHPIFPELWRGFLSQEAIWAPPIHVLEKEDKFVIKVELPGVSQEDISVSVIGDMLLVEGEKEAESEVKKKGYSYSETSYGSFSRSISIPSIVDANKIAAGYDKGILEIDLPKAVQVKPKKVAVTAKKKEKATGKDEKATGGTKEESAKK